MKRLRTALAPLLLALLATACRTSDWYAYDFAPAPHEARIADERVPEAQARALVTLVGIRRERDGNPARIEVRMRLQNLGTVPLTLRRDGLELVSAGLESFAPSELTLQEPVELKPDETIVHSFTFDLPPRTHPKDYNFEGAAFCWAVDFGQGPVTTSIGFQRLQYPDPCYYSHYGPGYGTPYPYGYYWW